MDQGRNSSSHSSLISIWGLLIHGRKNIYIFYRNEWAVWIIYAATLISTRSRKSKIKISHFGEWDEIFFVEYLMSLCENDWMKAKVKLNIIWILA